MSEILPDEPPTETVVDLSRVIALSDGVFAFALTLMVLEINLPPGLTSQELPAHMTALLPRLGIYFISFLTIGTAWDGHQRILRFLKQADGLLVWLNLVSLLFVTFLPATSGFLGSYPREPLAVITFAGNVIMIMLTSWVLWNHASSRQLIDEKVNRTAIRMINRRFLYILAAFLLTIPLAFVNIWLSFVTWLLTFAVSYFITRHNWQRSRDGR